LLLELETQSAPLHSTCKPLNIRDLTDPCQPTAYPCPKAEGRSRRKRKIVLQLLPRQRRG